MGRAPHLPTPPQHRRALALATAAVLLCAVPAVVFADAPPGPYFNGFEQNTAGWHNYSGATITRQPSGYVTGVTGYANAVPSASGDYHARLGIDPSPATCSSGGGPQPVFYGPYTDWGGDGAFFPTGGYTTRVDIYLDVSWAGAHLDRRFDWSSAIGMPNGDFRRDFVFNAGTEATGFVISGSNNATRCGAFPGNPGNAPVHVMVSGWYTFEHMFTGVAGGPLVVNMRLINKATNAVVGTWTRFDPSDIIGVTVGGNQYGWFVQNEIDQLAIDNSERTGIVSTPGCEIKISDGGSITALNTDKATFGGNAKVSLSGATSGEQTYQDHGSIQALTFKALTVQAVICSDDRTSAELYGTGSINGAGSHEYRIKLVDNGEPGTNDMYGIIIPDVGYASGDQTLDGGNVQIR
ncbi:MAG: large repetitive protein [Chloroflexota bacterium]|nr:large repetitive protein [Chloroflexota bacterium]